MTAVVWIYLHIYIVICTCFFDLKSFLISQFAKQTKFTQNFIRLWLWFTTSKITQQYNIQTDEQRKKNILYPYRIKGSKIEYTIFVLILNTVAKTLACDITEKNVDKCVLNVMGYFPLKHIMDNLRSWVLSNEIEKGRKKEK